MFNKGNHLNKILIVSVVLAVIMSALFAALPTTVYAGVDDGPSASPFPAVPKVAPGLKDDAPSVLTVEQQFEAQKKAWLIPAYNLAAKVQKYIKNRTARGLDSTELQGALNEFQSILLTADDGVAAFKLKHQSGFDDNEVSDDAAANNTVMAIGNSQRAFRATIRAAQARLLFVFNQTRGADSGVQK